MKNRIVTSLLILLLCAAAVATASASTQPQTSKPVKTRKSASGKQRATTNHSVRAPEVRSVKSFTEPGLGIGISLAPQLSSGTPSSVATWDTRAHEENAQYVRLDVDWSQVAPTEPASPSNPNSAGYVWSATDTAVEDLVHSGFTVMITIQEAPSWAEGANKPSAAAAGSWEPSPAELAAFGTAIATRYDGSFQSSGTTLPQVSYWQPWNEPNLPLYLSPSWVKSGSTWVDEAAIQYRVMLDDFYSAVKAVSAANVVVAAGTAPYGDPPGTLARIPPVTFDQDLFCLNSQNQPTGSCPNPAEFDILDHHPYVSGQSNEGPTWHAELAGDVAIPDIYKLTTVLHAAEAAATVLPAGNKPVWVTELAWESDPPQPQSSGVPVAEEALWGEQALYVLWSQGVSNVFWYQIGDPATNSGGLADTYDDGLYYYSGAPKPVAQSFRLPFITLRRSQQSVEAWGRAFAPGKLQVQQFIHGNWRELDQVQVKSQQVFEFDLSLHGAAKLRAVLDGADSMAWSQSA